MGLRSFLKGLHVVASRGLEKREDPYDVAYRWGWETPHLRGLVYACYKGPDLKENARRFYKSEELREAVRILIELGYPPRSESHVLDLGCGNGVGAYALSRAGFSVIAVDSSLGELAGINAAKRIRFLDGVSFEVRHLGDGQLDFTAASFDVVWMREVLHHIRDLPSLLKQIARVLKPGGLLCCLREVVIWSEKQRQHFFATHPFNHITLDEGCYYLAEYLAAFSEAGLETATILDPVASVINTYPEPVRAGAVFDAGAARQRLEGYDLYSFFLRKPMSSE
jgi:SAM-dependent methyltransferase